MAAQAEDEDYGDYVTRCICGFTHDDGYMICCDQCSVWQHVECMKVNPKNLPDKYLCEECEPRPVDKKKAKLIQMKKKDDISDDSSSDRANSVGRSTSASPHPPSIKKRKKAQRTSSGGTLRVHELKAEARRNKKEKADKEEIKKSVKKKSKHHHSSHHHHHTVPTPNPPTPLMSGLQTLLTAASALEEQQQQQENERSSKSMHPTEPQPSPDNSSIFNSTTNPWKDPYKIIDSNQYTDALKQEFKGRLDQLKKEAVVYTKEEYSGLGSFPLCLVRDVGVCRKGFVSEAHIPEDEMILEYKAKITTKDLLCTESAISDQLLWKQKPCPFVFQYDKISRLIVCLDARVMGNTARFIRRSCSPNAELRHFFVNDDIHFGVYAVNHISPEEEVSLPFDFPFEKCDYTMECACGKRNGSCHMLKQLKKAKRDSNSGGGNSEATSKPMAAISTQQHIQQHQQQQEPDQPMATPDPHHHPMRKPILKARPQVFQPDEDSNSSWTSTGSIHRRKIKRTFSQSSNSQQPSRDPTDSESEDVDELAKKRKSREERKNEAVWKMFEKMEARGRKKLNSLSDAGAQDEGTGAGITGPGSTIMKSDMKERRLSSSSRKVQLLPPIKHQLSSVSSSNEFMSPEHQEAFTSPPLTPSVPPPLPPPPLPPSSSLPTHYESSHQIDQSSYLTSPITALPKLTFEVTPYLHPKYLLADFALPRKKAILRQWEMEQREIMTCQENGNHNDWMVNGFAMACIKAMEGEKPRQRGCLKHRWIDMHNKQLQNDREDPKLPHKKRFLQRWIETTTESNLTVVSPTSLTPPPSSSPSPSLTSSTADPKTASEFVPEQVPLADNISEADRTPSPEPVIAATVKTEPVESLPLFDDFSDDDFEDVSESHHHDRGGVGVQRESNSKRPQVAKHRGSKDSTVPDDDTQDSTSTTGTTGTNNITSTTTNTNVVEGSSTVCLDQEDNIDKQDNRKKETMSFESISPEPMAPEPMASCSSDTEPTSINKDITCDQDNDQNEEATKTEEETTLEDNQEAVEMDISSPPLSGDQPELTTREDDVTTKPSTSSEMYIDGNERTDLLMSSGGMDPKPGPKKKMSLREYRSRSRKPSEQMQCKPLSLDTGQLSSVMATPTPQSPSSPPPTTRSSHSFLSYSSSFLSTSSASRITKPLGETVSSPVPTGSRISDNPTATAPPPQFEPVSPDDGGSTPVIDEVSRPSSLPPPPPPPPHPSSNIPPSSVSYNIPHTPTNIPPGGQQQMLWGVPHVSAGDVTQDPRRVQPPPPPHGQDMFIPCPPPNHQSTMSPQEMIHSHYPPPRPPPPPHSMPHPHHPQVPYNSIMHQQMRPPLGGMSCVPTGTGGGTGYGQQQPHPPPRMPHPPLLHQPPIRHGHPGNNNFYQ